MFFPKNSFVIIFVEFILIICQISIFSALMNIESINSFSIEETKILGPMQTVLLIPTAYDKLNMVYIMSN